MHRRTFAMLRVAVVTGAVALLVPLRAAGAPEQAPAAAAPRVSVNASALQRQTTLQFLQTPETTSYGSLSLTLSGELDRTALDRVAWAQNLVAKDDLGNLLVCVSSQITPSAAGRWSAEADMAGLHPGARKLAWVEGDVVAFARVDPITVEFPLPLGEKGAHRQVGEVQFELSDYSPGTDLAGPTLKGTVRAPQLTRLRGLERQFVRPVLIGASGKTYELDRSSGTTEIGGRGTIVNIDCGFGKVEEPINRVRVEVVYLHDPQRLFSFRVTDVVLPAERPFVPANRQSAPDSVVRNGDLPAGHPLFDANGGSLASGVRVGDAPAPPGQLWFGLTDDPEGKGPVRWVQTDVNEAGLARITHLKPGVYRIRRVYHSQQALAVRDGGGWVNEDVKVRVRPGQERQLPPLRWAVAQR